MFSPTISVIVLQKPTHVVRGVSESSDDELSSTSPTGGGFTRFARDSSRQSLTSQNVLKWASAQERAAADEEDESHDESADEAAPPPQSGGDNRTALEIHTDLHKV